MPCAAGTSNHLSFQFTKIEKCVQCCWVICVWLRLELNISGVSESISEQFPFFRRKYHAKIFRASRGTFPLLRRKFFRSAARGDVRNQWHHFQFRTPLVRTPPRLTPIWDGIFVSFFTYEKWWPRSGKFWDFDFRFDKILKEMMFMKSIIPKNFACGAQFS